MQQPLNKIKLIQNKDVTQDRKKASQILHYLMERKQESQFEDPFELLRNMNDVLYNYGEQIKPQTEENDYEENSLHQIANNSSSKRDQQGFNTGYGAMRQTQGIGKVFMHTKQNNSMYDTLTQSNNKRKNNRMNMTYLGGDRNESLTQRDLSFPDIKEKSQLLSEDTINNSAKKNKIKPAINKQIEKLLDTNIPEVTKMFDGLDYKYQRIMKLKEEFQDIKTQFTAPVSLKSAKNKKKSINISHNSQSILQTADSNNNTLHFSKHMSDSTAADQQYLYAKNENYDYQILENPQLENKSTLEETNDQRKNESATDSYNRTQSQPRQRLQEMIQKHNMSIAQIKENINSKGFKINVFNHTSMSNDKNGIHLKRERLLNQKRAQLALKSQCGLEEIPSTIGSQTVKRNSYDDNKHKQKLVAKHLRNVDQDISYQNASFVDISMNTTSNMIHNPSQERQFDNPVSFRRQLKNQINTGGYMTLQQLNMEKVRSDALKRFKKLYPKDSQYYVNDTQLDVESSQRELEDKFDKYQMLNKDSSLSQQQQTSRQAATSDPRRDQSGIDKNKQGRESFLIQNYGDELSKLKINIQPQQHAGVALYEQFVENKNKQLKMIKKQQKKLLKKQKKAQEKEKQKNASVENIYLRESQSKNLQSQGGVQSSKGGKRKSKQSSRADSCISQNRLSQSFLTKSIKHMIKPESKEFTVGGDQMIVAQSARQDTVEIQTTETDGEGILKEEQSLDLINDEFQIQLSKQNKNAIKFEIQQPLSQQADLNKRDQSQKVQNRKKKTKKIQQEKEVEEEIPIEVLMMKSSIFNYKFYPDEEQIQDVQNSVDSTL
ncbi:UNKNOWN [Stylonychia lemnae]|uniref:Uncharacterized protein n=1 Tax=Stylonychia lemnae TaxID=5949 RepID=A0A077ZRL6_STYLE|nr:UNKNOWN [Stylonychia lemnae]|eukprot:CDW72563.1 UNKNOWN [Stylonychia lemnae]